MDKGIIYLSDGKEIRGPFSWEDIGLKTELFHWPYIWVPGLIEWMDRRSADTISQTSNFLNSKPPSPPVTVLVPLLRRAFDDSILIAINEIQNGKTLEHTINKSVSYFNNHPECKSANQIELKITEEQLHTGVKCCYSNFYKITSQIPSNDDKLNKIIDELRVNNNLFDLFLLIEKGWVYYPLSDIQVNYFSTKILQELNKEKVIYLIKSEVIHPKISLKIISKLINDVEETKPNKFIGILISEFLSKWKKYNYLWIVFHVTALILSISFKNRIINFTDLGFSHFWPFVTFFECNDPYWLTVNQYDKSCFNGIFANYDISELIIYTVIPYFFINKKYIMAFIRGRQL